MSSNAIPWPSDAGRRRYIYLGDRFIPLDDAEGITHEMSKLSDDPPVREYIRVTNDRPEYHWLFRWADIEPGRLAYHYTKRCRLSSIESSGALHMGPMDALNDPREFEDWHFAPMVYADGPGKEVTQDQLALAREAAAEAQRWRRNSRVACFGLDPAESREPIARYMRPFGRRGYVRPQMWAHYAEGHSGVCIIFDRVALDRRFAETLASKAIQVRYPGSIPLSAEVVYSDSWESEGLFSQLHYRTEFELTKHLATPEVQTELFFTKSTDWQSEHEYRWVLVTDCPGQDSILAIPIHGCVIGLVLGLRFDDAYLDLK